MYHGSLTTSLKMRLLFPVSPCTRTPVCVTVFVWFLFVPLRVYKVSSQLVLLGYHTFCFCSVCERSRRRQEAGGGEFKALCTPLAAE